MTPEQESSTEEVISVMEVDESAVERSIIETETGAPIDIPIKIEVVSM